MEPSPRTRDRKRHMSGGAKARTGNFFDDFRLGQELVHATPRTVSAGDVAVHVALTGSRFALTSADSFAQAVGLARAPVDPLLVFNVVFGKTVADVSLNAVANLGYAEGRFLSPAYPGDSLSARSTVIGLKETSSGKTGIVYVRTHGTNQRGETVVEYVRWVLVPKRDTSAPAPEAHVPELSDHVPAGELAVPAGLGLSAYDCAAAGSDAVWEDYAPGERIDHVEGTTLEESEHMMATRLYQNTARAHFDAHRAKDTRFARRIVYGGQLISLARALSFNGLANAIWIAALNGGRHVGPAFAGDTVYAWSEVLDKEPLAGRDDVGALRLRTVAVRDTPCAGFPYKDAGGKYDPSVLLDLDYTVLMPRRAAGARG